MTTLVREPFESAATLHTSWSAAGATYVAGRTGNAASFQTGTATFSFAGADESDTLTVGVAVQQSSLAAQRALVNLYNASGTVQHNSIRANTDGSISVTRGTLTGTVIAGPTAAGLIVANTFAYVEVQIKCADTGGTVIVRVNGTEVINATGLDTRNGGTNANYGQVRLPGPGTGLAIIVDDVYIKSGAGETFLGAIAISDLRSFRSSARVLTGASGISPTAIQSAKHHIRVLTGLPLPPPEGGATVKVWSGTEFADAPVKVWDGSAWVDAEAVWTWDGAAFV